MKYSILLSPEFLHDLSKLSASVTDFVEIVCEENGRRFNVPVKIRCVDGGLVCVDFDTESMHT